MTNEELQAALAASPGERVTEEYIKSRIKTTNYFVRVSATVTVCNIELDNGFSVRGESACVDPINFNTEIGNQLAYDDAFRKLWPLFGFLLAEAVYWRTRGYDPAPGPQDAGAAPVEGTARAPETEASGAGTGGSVDLSLAAEA